MPVNFARSSALRVIGRKNWLFYGTDTHAEAAAAVFSLIATCRLHDGLTHIGVDELSCRRHHEYVTVVVDHDTQRIVWAKKGKNAATLKAFLDELGTDRVAKLEAVTIDISAAYIKAVTEASPQAQIIFDRFHVQRLAHDALDQVRRAEVREADTSRIARPSRARAGRCFAAPGTCATSRSASCRR